MYYDAPNRAPGEREGCDKPFPHDPMTLKRILRRLVEARIWAQIRGQMRGSVTRNGPSGGFASGLVSDEVIRDAGDDMMQDQQ